MKALFLLFVAVHTVLSSTVQSESPPTPTPPPAPPTPPTPAAPGEPTIPVAPIPDVRVDTRYGTVCNCSESWPKGAPAEMRTFCGAWNCTIKRPKVKCFSGDMTVKLNSGKVTQLHELKLGDYIVDSVDDENKVTYTRVVAFLHRDEDAHADFIHLRFGNQGLTVSSAHLLWSVKDSNFMSAESLSVGDTILVEGEESTVSSIEEVEKHGVYAPLTQSGKLLVNGVLASCYAHWPSHFTAHLSFAPLRVWDSINHFVGNEQHVQKGINWYAQWLQWLVDDEEGH
eukprot:TRINITY_DN93649_c0_g1_i1.p1 TRINITY_DN93649_c0_g1~~TRINITY_DN93649_c0_g1_i1.p1  ORF type:complete len:284 (-),score=18.51 TRINITY_DN93649_c0_g1_i1:158-1009(-)